MDFRPWMVVPNPPVFLVEGEARQVLLQEGLGGVLVYFGRSISVAYLFECRVVSWRFEEEDRWLILGGRFVVFGHHLVKV